MKVDNSVVNFGSCLVVAVDSVAAVAAVSVVAAAIAAVAASNDAFLVAVNNNNYNYDDSLHSSPHKHHHL